jgi:thiol-disulfide isomerase/thioredoxin
MFSEERMSPSRHAVAAALALALLVALRPADAPAAPMVSYSKQAFLDAQAAGKPIVVFVHAPWCVTCRKQEPIVKQLTGEPAFAGVVVFVVDYDNDKQTLRELKVADRSTLVAFRGKTERKRSSFVTAPAEIRALFESAL